VGEWKRNDVEGAVKPQLARVVGARYLRTAPPVQPPVYRQHHLALQGAQRVGASPALGE
jgi:hypothetical protein